MWHAHFSAEKIMLLDSESHFGHLSYHQLCMLVIT